MTKKAVKKAARKHAPPAMTPVVSPAVRQLVPVSHIRAFEEVLQLIQSAKDRASPAMVAEYETMLPDKELLKAKLHEFYQHCAPTGRGQRTGQSACRTRQTKAEEERSPGMIAAFKSRSFLPERTFEQRSNPRAVPPGRSTAIVQPQAHAVAASREVLPGRTYNKAATGI